MYESATAFAEEIKTLGEKIVGLTLKQAKELSDYLKEVHGIEAAAGGAVMMAAPADAAPAGADRHRHPLQGARWRVGGPCYDICS